MCPVKKFQYFGRGSKPSFITCGQELLQLSVLAFLSHLGLQQVDVALVQRASEGLPLTRGPSFRVTFGSSHTAMVPAGTRARLRGGSSCSLGTV